ncbi:hypothetical protein [Vreelandella titanicae]|uniref:hypothetical protein n=1 Tax=Vreelandella titanicae TaxID=664683 RepID=UPI00241DF366|nr:hypothetical protein [Halomonas titanicae]
MAAKQYVVARGQIEKGKEVLAKLGELYKPKDAAEEKRLVDAGVIAELGAPAKGKGTSKAKRSAIPPETPPGGTGGDGNGGDGQGTGTGGDSGGGSGGE